MAREPRPEIDDLPRIPHTPMTQVLEQLMSDLSEQCWCASWLTECEVEIWELLAGRRTTWGMYHRDEIADELHRIAAMALVADAWIVWGPSDADTVPVKLSDWMAATS